MEKTGKSIPFWLTDAAVICAAAAILSLFYFRGFGEADDVAYTLLTQALLNGQHPFQHAATAAGVTAGRPGVICPTALSVLLLGWTEFAVILPTFLLSLLEIGACYFIALKNGGRAIALASSLALALFPLHWSYSTTMCADIMGSAVFWLGFALASQSWSAAPGKRARAWAVAGGLLMGLSFSVKVNTLFMLPPLALTGLVAFPRLRREPAALRQAHGVQLAWVTGAVLAGMAAVFVFFGGAAHTPLASIRAEVEGNRNAYAAVHAAMRRQLLAFYPELMARGLRWPGRDYAADSPYGMFFILAWGACAAAVWRGERWIRTAAAWLVVLFALYEFWPLALHPYAPIHRLERHLAPLGVPGALLIGWGVVRLWNQSRHGRLGAVLLALCFAATSWASVRQISSFHRQCLQDLRAAYGFVHEYWDGPVACSQDLFDYFQMREPDFRKKHPTVILASSLQNVPAGSLVIRGGSQRPTSNPDFSEVGRPAAGTRWIEIARHESARKTEGLLPLRFYLVQGSAAPAAELSAADRFAELSLGHCGRGSWELRDRIDFGDWQSRDSHQLRMGNYSFIARRLQDERGAWTAEAGTWTRGDVSYRAHNLVPGQPLCVARLTTDEEDNLPARLYFDERLSVATSDMSQVPMGQWRIGILRLPGASVEPDLRIRETSPDAAYGWPTFRVDFYQPAAR